MDFIEDDPMEDVGPLNLELLMVNDEFENEEEDEVLIESKYKCNPCNITMRNENEFLWHHTAHCTYPQIRLKKLKSTELSDHTHKRRPKPLSKLRKNDICKVKNEESVTEKIQNNKKLKKVIKQLLNPNALQIPSNNDTIKIIKSDRHTTSNQKISSNEIQGKISTSFAQTTNPIHTLDTFLLKSAITKYSEQNNINKIDDNFEKSNLSKSKWGNQRKSHKKRATEKLNVKSTVETSFEINLPIDKNITSKDNHTFEKQDLSINPRHLSSKTSVQNNNLPIDRNITSKTNQSVEKQDLSINPRPEYKHLDKTDKVCSNSVLSNKPSKFICTYPDCNSTSFPNFNDYEKHLMNIDWKNPQTSFQSKQAIPDNNNTKKLNIENPTPCQFLPNFKNAPLTQIPSMQSQNQDNTKSTVNHNNNNNFVKLTKQETNNAQKMPQIPKFTQELSSNVLKSNSRDLGEAPRNVTSKGFNPFAGNRCQKKNQNIFNGIKNTSTNKPDCFRCPNWPCNRSFAFERVLNIHMIGCPYGRRYVNHSISCQYCFQTFFYRLDFKNHLSYCMHFNQNYYYNYQSQPFNHFM